MDNVSVLILFHSLRIIYPGHTQTGLWNPPSKVPQGRISCMAVIRKISKILIRLCSVVGFGLWDDALRRIGRGLFLPAHGF